MEPMITETAFLLFVAIAGAAKKRKYIPVRNGKAVHDALALFGAGYIGICADSANDRLAYDVTAKGWDIITKMRWLF